MGIRRVDKCIVRKCSSTPLLEVVVLSGVLEEHLDIAPHMIVSQDERLATYRKWVGLEVVAENEDPLLD